MFPVARGRGLRRGGGPGGGSHRGRLPARGAAATGLGALLVAKLLDTLPQRGSVGRKFACQALQIEEFAQAGTKVEFVKGPRVTAPRTSFWCSSRTSRWNATDAAMPSGPAAGRSMCWAAPREDWIEIPVPTIRDLGHVRRGGQQRLADNKRLASRKSKVPSLLPGLAACSACGYGYYRTSTPDHQQEYLLNRCLGSDDYRYEHGGSAATNRSAPTTSTPSPGTTSRTCSPTPR
jgi:hypothetical protein